MPNIGGKELTMNSFSHKKPKWEFYLPTNKGTETQRGQSQRSWILAPGCITCLFYELGNTTNTGNFKNLLFFLNLGIIILILPSSEHKDRLKYFPL